MSEKRDDGGPAFPMSGDPAIDFDRGMTLRDYFAATAPEPPKWWIDDYKSYTSQDLGNHAQHVAQWKWVYADAMLKERAK